MGNTNTHEADYHDLLIRNRLLLRQAQQGTNLDPTVKHSIADVKKNRRYTSLVFTGTGLQSLSYLGSLEYLQHNRYLSNIKNIACAGFGSIIAVLYAVGYTISEIKTIMMKLDYRKLSGSGPNLSSDIFHVATEFGVNNGQYLIDYVTKLIEKRAGNRNYTLEQLYKEKSINLVGTASDLTSGKTLTFWYGQYPKMPLRLLVRIACSIPSYFCPVIFEGHYLVSNLSDNMDTIFDGLYPSDPLYTSPNPEVLVLYPFTRTNGLPAPKTAHNYYASIIQMLQSTPADRAVDPVFWERSIPIHLHSPDSVCISTQDITDWYRQGYDDSKKFFE